MAAAVSRKSYNSRLGRTGDEARVVMQHRRHDAGGAIGGRRDHAPAGGVFLIHRQRVEIHPVQHDQRIAQCRLGIAA